MRYSQSMSPTGKALEGALRAYLATRPEVQVGYLFGSQATGLANRLSDIDVAILVDERPQPDLLYPYGYKARVYTELMTALSTNRVDLVILNEASVLLRHRVIAFGRPVYVRDEPVRIRFEAQTMSRYPDVKRLLAAHH